MRMQRSVILLAALAGFGRTPLTAQLQATSNALDSVVHQYRHVNGRALQAFVFRTDPSRRAPAAPAVLLFHGGGWSAGSPEWTFSTARQFASLGLVAIPIEYRLSGDSVTPIDALDDVCAAFHWVRRQARDLGVDPRRVAGYGVSAGGHLAAAAATIGCGVAEGAYGTGGPDALVLWSPALDVRRDGWFRRLLSGRAEPEDYSPVEHVRPRMPPVSIVHGTMDNLTPVSGSRRFCELVTTGGGRCELHEYEGVGHLLTRNLENQERDFDPDPVARADGRGKQDRFLLELWLDRR